MSKVFSFEIKNCRNHIKFFGIDIKWKNQRALAERRMFQEVIQDIQHLKYHKSHHTLADIRNDKSVNQVLYPAFYNHFDAVFAGVPALFNKPLNVPLTDDFELNENEMSDKLICVWGFSGFAVKFENFRAFLNSKIIFCEDCFLRSIQTPKAASSKEYLTSVGAVADELGFYFDATRPSRLELLLNSEDFQLTEAQTLRAKMLIKKITDNYLSKYNHQPIFIPDWEWTPRKKVLVIDQSYGDFSIAKGLADDKTFEIMLQKAIEENPEAEILVKTHPDALAKNKKGKTHRKGYYTNLTAHGNVKLLTFNLNPIALLKHMDKVYVCSSQMGFEALMCGKEVHTFGMPFYANWGLTVDYQNCARRTQKHTLEEVFFAAYVLYSNYINPDTMQPCEIEDAIRVLLKLRKKYFTENNLRLPMEH